MWSEVTVGGTQLPISLLGAPAESSGSETKSVRPPSTVLLISLILIKYYIVVL